MCYFVICSNIQSSIIILVINYDPLYVTYLTFDLDLFDLFSILTFDLDLKNGEKSREIG